MMKRIVIIGIILSFNAHTQTTKSLFRELLNGTTVTPPPPPTGAYYFSTTDGDDSRTSTQAQNPATPWKTITKLNSFFSSLAAGNQALFKKGDTFYGTINISKSGTSGNPIIIGAYGTGANPIITGFQDVTAWTSLGGNKWQSTSTVSTLSTLNMVALNGNFLKVGTFPNSGYNTINSSTGGTSITSTSLTLNYVGGTVAARKQHWIIDKSTITSQTGTTINFTNPSAYTLQNGWGFVILNHTNACDSQNEWWYDVGTKKLGIFSTVSPSGIKAANLDNLVTLSSFQYITFSGVDFQGSNGDMVTGVAPRNISFLNCNIQMSGINFMRVQTAAANCTIDNCSIDRTNNDVLDAAGSTGWTITNNNVTNTAQFPGSGSSGDGQYIAFYNMRDNSVISNNTIKNTGYIAIDFRGGATTVSYNLVDTFCNIKDDGGGIYTFTGSTTTTYSMRYIFNNIVMNGNGAGAGTNTTNSDAFGIYMDDNSSQVTGYNNTVANCGSAGIFFHASHDLNYYNNTVYNCVLTGGYGQLLEIYPGAVTTAPVTNITFKQNKIVSRTATQLVAYLQTNAANMAAWGTWDSNYYCRPLNDNSSNYFQVNRSGGNSTTNLAGWQTQSGGLDPHSKRSPINVANTSLIRFEYNASSVATTVNLGAVYVDVTGVVYNGSIVLQPFTSAVLLFQSALANNLKPNAKISGDTAKRLPAKQPAVLSLLLPNILLRRNI